MHRHRQMQCHNAAKGRAKDRARDQDKWIEVDMGIAFREASALAPAGPRLLPMKFRLTF